LVRQAGLVADQDDVAVEAFLAKRGGALGSGMTGADDQNLLKGVCHRGTSSAAIVAAARRAVCPCPRGRKEVSATSPTQDVSCSVALTKSWSFIRAAANGSSVGLVEDVLGQVVGLQQRSRRESPRPVSGVSDVVDSLPDAGEGAVLHSR
jgi:hypothetical protein